MKKRTKVLAVALGLMFCGGLISSGCTAYNVQAKDSQEGKAWITDGGTLWHCSGSASGANCKKVLD